MTPIDNLYFKEYKEKIGFSNQNNIKAFFGAKDIVPTVDYKYINLLNKRLFEIIEKIDIIVAKEIKSENLKSFYDENIENVFKKLKRNKIIAKLNNQGRRIEDVYFSWMRGMLISTYFLKALSYIFEVNIDKIKIIGEDDFTHLKSFKRTPKADLQIELQNGKKIRIEMQAGFQGINDIKQHKVLEAKKIKREEDIFSMIIHFDFFNGQVAFIKTDSIDDDSINWITRQQMEGQTVFNIDQNYFIWKLTELPPKFRNLSFE
jgi:hypothetical protein